MSQSTAVFRRGRLLLWGACLAAAFALPEGSQVARLTITQLAPILPYLLMVAILVFRPRGLMGSRES